MRAFALLATLALAGCTSARAGDQSSEEQWDLVKMEANSWGRMLSGWSIGPDGSGGWWVRENADGSQAPYGAYTVTYRSFEAGPEGFARVREALAAIPDPAPDPGMDCDNFMTDAVYGTLRITRQATTTETAWNEGCLDDGYVAMMDGFRAADELVEGWARAGTVSRIEHFDENGVGTGTTFPDEE